MALRRETQYDNHCILRLNKRRVVYTSCRERKAEEIWRKWRINLSNVNTGKKL